MTCFFQTNTTYIQWFYFIGMRFFVLHDVQSNGTLPCGANFAHTCTNTFFKEYHHCLKWVLKGFFPTILHYYTLYFPEMRYSCEWNTNVMRHFYISSERREHCIHAGFFFEFHVFFQVQYGCIYWGILCQSNVAFVSKECPTVLKCITRFNRTLQNSN